MVTELFIAFIFLALLIGALYGGWKFRRFVERFENMEKVVRRRDLPNAVKAGLEDLWSLADMAKMLQGNSKERMIGLALLLKQQISDEEAASALLDSILKDAASLRSNPKGYDADKPLKDH